MKMKPFIIALFCLLLPVFGAFAGERENTQLFLEGLKAYGEGDYALAIESFSRIAESGVRNGKLYYNLGNAYLRINDTGHAILWYERALKLIPDDPDLHFNLEYARSFIKDEQPEGVSVIWRVLFFWKFLLNPAAVIWLAVILNVLLWTLVLMQTIRKRKAMNIRTVIAALLTAVFALTAVYNYYETAHIRSAVVLPATLSVRSGLSDNATELFVLHAGTRVKIEKEMNGYCRIQYVEGKIGWVSGESIGLI